MKKATGDIFSNLFKRYPSLIPEKSNIEKAYLLLEKCFKNEGRLYICGNGGSAADSEHITGELMKPFLIDRPLDENEKQKLYEKYPEEACSFSVNLKKVLPCYSLCAQMGLYTAYCNDINPEMVFAQQIYGYGKKGDVLLAISTSGNSRNVINAIKVANTFGVDSISLTSYKGVYLKSLSTVTICVPGDKIHHIQELHLPVYHTICAMLEQEFFGKGEAL
jgi:D-sedoheptulose 7-phosphate isomerase